MFINYRFRLNEPLLLEMNNYLDQILVSIRSLSLDEWNEDFGHTKHTEDLFDDVLNILESIKKTEIILEVSTVIHRENIENVIQLGWRLFELNPKVVWQIKATMQWV